ncbi:hypothetical protein [Streptomyces sp. NRRL B-24085]|uniref:hypothetical protein n=1 Tax=Streptomyces sp. NRRL B-24085 TaxID=1709476 RepID=UPI0006B33AED|nr:hypothetical protein [Streptomyces sp. NRRL B-24085]
MSDPHGVDPRAHSDPRNVYPSDEEFYRGDRPRDAALPEDRPRGGGTSHRGRLFTVVLIAFIALVVIVWFLAFP